jgi:hypothetical protein
VADRIFQAGWRVLRIFFDTVQPLPAASDLWAIIQLILVAIGLGGVVTVGAIFADLTTGVTAMSLVLTALFFLALYRAYSKLDAASERRKPDNLADLIKALYQLRKVSDEVLSSLMMIAYIKRTREESGKSADDLFLGADRIQELLDARHELELQELVAGPDFKRILELYRWQIELETDMCRDPAEPLTQEQFQNARRKVRDVADRAIELLHEGKLYMRKPSISHKAKSPPPPTS